MIYFLKAGFCFSLCENWCEVFCILSGASLLSDSLAAHLFQWSVLCWRISLCRAYEELIGCFTAWGSCANSSLIIQRCSFSICNSTLLLAGLETYTPSLSDPFFFQISLQFCALRSISSNWLLLTFWADTWLSNTQSFVGISKGSLWEEVEMDHLRKKVCFKDRKLYVLP